MTRLWVKLIGNIINFDAVRAKLVRCEECISNLVAKTIASDMLTIYDMHVVGKSQIVADVPISMLAIGTSTSWNPYTYNFWTVVSTIKVLAPATHVSECESSSQRAINFSMLVAEMILIRSIYRCIGLTYTALGVEIITVI